MTLRAAFLGINKHSDPSISELTGATKDATALWALFKDSVPDMIDTRLLDERATATGIRAALDDALGSATADDTVVVFFAGHGTPEHQLVPYDAECSSLSETTIPMQEIADRLKATQARASVVILDCCFSGGAPARVLDGIPVARSRTLQITDLAGEGRIILAASAFNQEALEFGQHGLFTAALLRVLQDGPGWTDIGVLMDEVTRQVRAEASRTGHNQSPAWAGHIEGGIQLPPLQRGPLFGQEFPNTAGIRVGAPIAQLKAFGAPQPVLDAWGTRFEELNSLQLSAVNDYRILDGQPLLVVAPTTSGKTFVGELAAAQAISDGRKAVFLLPFKALANEKYEEFDKLYGERLGLRVVRCTGDFTDQTERFVKGQYDVALLTYEMFLGLSVAMPMLLAKIGLVVLDEAQFVTNPTRGIAVELLLTNLIAARERGINPQIVALSAVIGDVNQFDQWLGCQTLETDNRPVPLIEGVLDRNGTYQYLDSTGHTCTEQLLESHEIVQRGNKASSQDVIVPLVSKLVNQGEQVLVFRNKKGSTSGCANYLAAELNQPPATEVLEALPDQDLSNTSEQLQRALKGGMAFHTSDLSREERLVVERAFRDREGPIRVLAATSTVAAGVNTPVETVVIVETDFPGPTPQPYTVAEYKNMAGRAGRLGLAAQGRSILLADSSMDRQRLFTRYVCGKPEAIRSSFDPNELDTWILRLLAQVHEIPRRAVITMLANTYAGYLEARASQTWEASLRIIVEDLLCKMLELELLEEEAGHVRLSLLGKACGKSHLKMRSAIRLVELLRAASPASLSADALMATVHALQEFDDAYTPMSKKSPRETEWQHHVTQKLGTEITRALQFGAPDVMAYHARCKRVAVLLAWMDGVPINQIESTFTVNSYVAPVAAGNIRGFNELARFHLAAAFDIADVLALEHGPSSEDVGRLLTQLEYGLPADALRLLHIPISLERGSYLALHNAGLSCPEDVWTLNQQQLGEIVGPRVAANLESARPTS
jgi:helicase